MMTAYPTLHSPLKSTWPAGAQHLFSTLSELRYNAAPMGRFTISTLVYIATVVVAAALSALMAFMPQGELAMATESPVSPVTAAAINAGVVLVVYGGFGWLGLVLARRLGYPDVWDAFIATRERFTNPAIAGLWLGLLFIVADNIFGRFHSLGPLPHPPFPTSLVASFQAGAGEEMLFRLFFIPVVVWFVSRVMLNGQQQNAVFWVAAIFSAFFFAAAHIPTVMLLLDRPFDAIPAAILAEIFFINGTISLVAAFFLKRAGFLAAVTVHASADIVWHVIWGLMR